MATITVRMTTPPYQGISAQDGLDFAMAATNYGHEVQILFEGEGVAQLAGQLTPPTGMKSHTKRLKALPFFDIEELYYCTQSAQARLTDGQSLAVAAEPLSADGVKELMNSSDHIVTF
ncbi:DsrE family protein [Alteromonas sp. ASW11-19]|uniref:DsrE family protein n=1 Tax=Alteromonas salexigens TaxID=2982530 RepID=A0ABT2VLA2_9ALTE|nr:DsrE family protein [Alteromonas salexigens]MCU7554092.1 DsrE family protein [Alteromonas salexigens]